MPEGPPPDSTELGYYFTLAQVGVEMVAPLIVGLVIDYYLDSSPWFTISGVVFGFVGGILHIVHVTNQHDARLRRRDPPKSDSP